MLTKANSVFQNLLLVCWSPPQGQELLVWMFDFDDSEKAMALFVGQDISANPIRSVSFIQSITSFHLYRKLILFALLTKSKHSTQYN